MVQRKASNKLGSQPEPKKQQETRSKGGGGGGGGGDLKTMMKRLRSIRASDLATLEGPSSEHKHAQFKSSTGSPNYMKPTSSWDARRERPQVTIHSPAPTDKKRTLWNSKNLKMFSMKSFSKRSRPSMNRATCSSTLKDSKFPKALDLDTGGTEAEGTSVIKVCPYTYCSLNGHTHQDLPSLKCFMSARRKLLKTQKSLKLKEPPLFGLKGEDTGQTWDLSGFEIEEVAGDFFVEVYAEPKEDDTDNPHVLGELSSIQDDLDQKSDFSVEQMDAVMNSLEFVEFDQPVEVEGENIVCLVLEVEGEMKISNIEATDEDSEGKVVPDDVLGPISHCFSEDENTGDELSFKADIPDVEEEQSLDVYEEASNSNGGEERSGIFCNGKTSDVSDIHVENQFISDIHVENQFINIFDGEEFEATDKDLEGELVQFTNIKMDYSEFPDDVLGPISYRLSGDEKTGDELSFKEDISDVDEEQSVEVYEEASTDDDSSGSNDGKERSGIFCDGETSDVSDNQDENQFINVLDQNTKTLVPESPEENEEGDELIIEGSGPLSSEENIYDSSFDGEAFEGFDGEAFEAADLEIMQNFHEQDTDAVDIFHGQAFEAADLETMQNLDSESSDNTILTDEATEDPSITNVIHSSAIDQSEHLEINGMMKTEDDFVSDVDDVCRKPRIRIVGKRTTEESEQTKEFNPRSPRFLPIEPDPEAEKVDLRHQMADERRNSEEWMIDYALQRAVTKLGPARKKKVALLVEAFETVIPLPMYEEPLRHAASGFAHVSPIQACS